MGSKNFEIKHGLNVRNGAFIVDEIDGTTISNGLNVGNGKVTIDQTNGILVDGTPIPVAPDTTGLDENSVAVDLPTGNVLFPATVDGVTGKILATKQSDTDENPQEFFFGQSGSTINQLTRFYQSPFVNWVLDENFDSYTEGANGSVLDDNDFGAYVRNPNALAISGGNVTINSANMPDADFIDVEGNYDIEKEGVSSSDPQGDFDMIMELSNISLDTNFSYQAASWYPSDATQSLSTVGLYADLSGTLGYVCVGACNHPDPAIGQSWGVFSFSPFTPSNLNDPDVFVPRSTNFGKVRMQRTGSVTRFYYSEGTDAEGNDVWTEISYTDTSGWVGKAWSTGIFATGGTTTTATISRFQLWAEFVQLESNSEYLVQTDPHEATESWTNWKDLTTDTLLSGPISLENDLTVKNQTVTGKISVSEFEDLSPISFNNKPTVPNGIDLSNDVYSVYDYPRDVSYSKYVEPIDYNFVNISSNTFSMTNLSTTNINSAGSGEPYNYHPTRNQDMMILSDSSVTPAVCNVYDFTGNVPALKSVLSRTQTTETAYGSVATMAEDWLFVKENADVVGNILINIYSYDGTTLTYSSSITQALGDYTLQKIASNGVYMAASYYNSITGDGHINLYKYDGVNWTFNQAINFVGISDAEFGINLSISQNDGSGKYHILTSSPNFGGDNSGKVYFYQIDVTNDTLSSAIEIESPTINSGDYGINFGKVAKILSLQNNSSIFLAIYENTNDVFNRKVYLYQYYTYHSFSINSLNVTFESYIIAGDSNFSKNMFDAAIRSSTGYMLFTLTTDDGLHLAKFELNGSLKELSYIPDSFVSASNAFIAYSDSADNAFVYNSGSNSMYQMQRQYVGNTIDNSSPLPSNDIGIITYNGYDTQQLLTFVNPTTNEVFYRNFYGTNNVWHKFAVDAEWENVETSSFSTQPGGRYYTASSGLTGWFLPSVPPIGTTVEIMMNSVTGTLTLSLVLLNGVTSTHTVIDSAADRYYVKLVYAGSTLGWTYA